MQTIQQDAAVSSSQDTEIVCVFRRGQLTEIIPPVDGLENAFLTAQYVGRNSQKRGFEIVSEAYSLVWPDTERIECPSPRQFMQTLAGLEEFVCDYAQKIGRKVKLTGHRPKEFAEPNWSALGGRRGDRRLLRLVQHHDRGLIRYRQDQVDLAWCIAQIALAWPKERVMVVVTRQHDAENLAKQLRQLTPEVSIVTTKHHPSKAKRIAVVRHHHMRQVGVRAEKRTILISVNPTELLYGTRWFQPNEWLAKLKGRLYGFLPEKAAIAPHASDLLWALFGQHRIFIPKHGFYDLPVQVISLPFHGGKKLLASSDGRFDIHAVKRDFVWRDAHRNRWIAGLARAIAEGNDYDLINKYGETGHALIPQLDRRVGILVENLDHAAALLQRLKDWPIVADPTVCQQGLSSEVQQAIEAGANHSVSRTADVIVTTRGLKSAGVFDVLIRADAGTGLPVIADSFFVAGDGMGKQLVIVDVDDRHHPELRIRARRRRECYAGRGWTTDGGPPWHPSDDYEVFPEETGTVLRIGYLSKKKNTSPLNSATAAYFKRSALRASKHSNPKNQITLKKICHPDLLYASLQELRQRGGAAPGIDKIRYSDLSPSEWGTVLKKLSKTVLAGRYRPQVARKVPIPKPGTAEKRILSIGSTCDRILAHAVDLVVKPAVDKLFLPGSWGFRQKRGVWQMLAHLKRNIEKTQRWVLAIDDVRKAFDNVPIAKLIESMQKVHADLKILAEPVILNESVVKLLGITAKGTLQTRIIGIDQGHNLAPLGLNVVLHYVHDLPLTAAVGFPFWYRYADNLVYLCQNVAEGWKMLNQASDLLQQSGLILKGKDGVTDLRKSSTQLLGFQLREKSGLLQFSVSEQTWKCLEEHLRDAHLARDPLEVAEQVISGWVNAFGPAFEKGKPVVSRVCALANRFGFREISRERIEVLVAQAWERWKKMLEQTFV